MGESNESRLVRYIEGEAIVTWLKGAGVRAFRYRANVPGAWLLMFSALMSVGVAGWMGWRSGLSLPVHKAGFFVLVGFATWCLWVVVHWGFFAMRNYVGLSDTHLLVGRGPRAYLVPLERLDQSTVRMDRMQRGKYTSVLPIEVDDYKTAIHLVGPFANLQHLQVFIGELLVQLLDEEDQDAADDTEVFDGA